MGTWGTGLYSDDSACDVRDTYKHYLRLGSTPEQAVKKLVDEFQPDIDLEEDGYLFWLALADTQWKLGHLTLEGKRKALDILDFGYDRERWAEAPAADRKKRAAVLEGLREKLSSPQPAFQKVAPYRPEKPLWKVGDIISMKFGLVEIWIEHARTSGVDPETWGAYVGKYGAAQVVAVYERENTYEQIVDRHAVLAMFDWVGSTPPALEALERAGFVRQDRSCDPQYTKPVLRPMRRDILRDEITLIGHTDRIPGEVQAEVDKTEWKWNSVDTCSGLYYDAIRSWIKSGRKIP